MERCDRCAQPRTFVGFDFKGRRVLTCTANYLTADTEPAINESGESYDRITGHSWVPCDGTNSMFVEGKKERMVRWWKKH